MVSTMLCAQFDTCSICFKISTKASIDLYVLCMSVVKYIHCSVTGCQQKLNVGEVQQTTRQSRQSELPQEINLIILDKLFCQNRVQRITTLISQVANHKKVTIKSQGDAEEQRLKMLECWKQRCGSTATYKAMIKALLQISRTDLAEKVALLRQFQATFTVLSVVVCHRHENCHISRSRHLSDS